MEHNSTTTAAVKVGLVCRATSIILEVLSLIGAGVLAGSVYTLKHDDFNFPLFFVLVFSSFLFCLTLYALGCIVDLLVSNELYQRQISAKLCHIDWIASKADNNTAGAAKD